MKIVSLLLPLLVMFLSGCAVMRDKIEALKPLAPSKTHAWCLGKFGGTGRRKRRTSVFAAIGSALILLFAAPAFAASDILEIVTISGVIDSSTASDITKQVEDINENPKVKAVLLVIDTPGGSVTASSAIYEELTKLKVPVVAWCMSMCASGGVYVMMAPSVKYIGVRSETITGSVGVIMQITRFNRLLDWARIDNETFKSGTLKDSGNPTREMNDVDRAYLQGIVGTLAEKFYAIVAKARPKISADGWKEVKTAKILIGAEAIKVGLVDAVATRQEMIDKAKALSGSKQIFTRDEAKKLFAAASGDSKYSSVREPNLLADLTWVIGIAKEVRAGESIRLEYRAPGF